MTIEDNRMNIKYFLFNRQCYTQHSFPLGDADAFHHRLIKFDWFSLPNEFTSDIDTVINNTGTGVLYFLKGSEYVSYSLKDDKADSEPRLIESLWPGLKDVGFDADIDAAVHILTPSGKPDILFFKNDKYIQYSLEKSVVALGPVSIASKWPGLQQAGFTENIDSALNWNDGNIYFFKDDKYVKCSLSNGATPTGSAPQLIEKGWGGIKFVSASFLIGHDGYGFAGNQSGEKPQCDGDGGYCHCDHSCNHNDSGGDSNGGCCDGCDDCDGDPDSPIIDVFTVFDVKRILQAYPNKLSQDPNNPTKLENSDMNNIFMITTHGNVQAGEATAELTVNAKIGNIIHWRESSLSLGAGYSVIFYKFIQSNGDANVISPPEAKKINGKFPEPNDEDLLTPFMEQKNNYYWQSKVKNTGKVTYNFHFKIFTKSGHCCGCCSWDPFINVT